MTRGWLILALVAGCGDDDFDDAPRSGARLKLEWTEGEDGSRVSTGAVKDSMLGVYCEPNPWSDGAWRCAPQNGFVGYADADCKQALVIDAAPGDLVSEFLPATCKMGRAFRVGPASSVTQFYLSDVDRCNGPFSGGTIYSTDGELDPNTFAGVRLTELQGDGRLRTIDFVSDDGFHQIKETRDTELGTGCNPTLGECSPVVTYEVDYLDAACTQPVAAVYRDACGPPPAYVAQADPACPNHTIYNALGPAMTSQVYEKSDTCAAKTPTPSIEYHSIGAPVSPAKLTTALGNAPGRRLQQIYFAGEGIAARSGQLMDTQIGVACDWITATDAMTRCLPMSAYVASYYGDGNCTVPITVAVSPTSTACAPQPVPQFAIRSAAVGNEIRVITGRHAGAIYSGPGGSNGCLLVDTYDAYDLGGLVDPSSFVAATTVLDP